MIVHAGEQYLAPAPEERDAVSWVSVFAGFLVAHMVGDYLLQTDWQARHKRGGLSDPAARRPLRDPRRHVHARLRARLRVDRERARRRLGGRGGACWSSSRTWWSTTAASCACTSTASSTSRASTSGVASSVDQSFHVLSLWLVALLLGAA